MSIFEAVIIAIVEGITEFLPVSSTGHMIITQELLGMSIDDFVKAFTVNIQFGAILSVIVLYWKRFFQSFDFYYKLFVAFLPAAIIGFLMMDLVDQMLGSVLVVAIMLVVGGVILIFADRWFNKPKEQQEISWATAFKVGLFQCIAMIPGVSRSAATIIGGMTQGLNRKTAAEFSFFLAIPTMFAASGYKLLKNYEIITQQNISVLLIGNLVAFIVAMIAIKTFITLLTRYGFKWFGYYRIIVGVAILVMLSLGFDLNLAD
jgi:undecaprenyl-diphosphatase